MQVRTDSIEKRSRYYHSHMDMEALQRGLEYELLPDSYVIFICDFDPVGAGKYVYTEGRYYLEAPEYPVQDGHHTIFLSTCGKGGSPGIGEGLWRCVYRQASGQYPAYQDQPGNGRALYVVGIGITR